MSVQGNDKIMGFIPKHRYVYFMYMLLLVAAAFGVFVSLLSLIGITAFASFGPGATILGLLGVIMAVMGIFVYADEFTPLDRSHFLYAVVAYMGVWIAALILGSAFSFVLILSYIIVIALGIAQAVLLWTGYNSWQGGRVITKHNLKGEIQTAIKNR